MCKDAYVIGAKDRVGSAIMWDLRAMYYCHQHDLTFRGTIKHRDVAHKRHKIHKLASQFFGLPEVFDKTPSDIDKNAIILKKRWPNPNGKESAWKWYNNQFNEDINFLANIRKLLTLTIKKRSAASIHIRRGDVNPDKWADRYIDLEPYLQIVKKLTNKYTPEQITIHTDGHTRDVQSVLDLGCRLTTNNTNNSIEDFIAEWTDMITAETLVISKSMFSYLPALYNTSTVIYPEWIQKDRGVEYDNIAPLNNWIEYNQYIHE